MAKIKINDIIVSCVLKSEYAKKNPQVLKWIEQDLDKMIEYYKHVYSMEQRIELARATMDIDAFQDRCMELDRQRTDKHNAAIAAVIDLNSCTIQAGFSKCVNVDDLESQHRTDIAEAIYDFCNAWVRRNK